VSPYCGELFLIGQSVDDVSLLSGIIEVIIIIIIIVVVSFKA
jgi:hypothetical protein